MKTVFSHYTIISFDVQLFKKLLNFQSLNSSMPSSGNHCCYISLSLKITNSYKYRPLAETYSMIVVFLYRLGSFLKVLRFSTISNIRPLALIPCIKPVSSIFYWSVCMTFLMTGKSKNGNHIWITSIVAPLIRTTSIRRI